MLRVCIPWLTLQQMGTSFSLHSTRSTQSPTFFILHNTEFHEISNINGIVYCRKRLKGVFCIILAYSNSIKIRCHCKLFYINSIISTEMLYRYSMWHVNFPIKSDFTFLAWRCKIVGNQVRWIARHAYNLIRKRYTRDITNITTRYTLTQQPYTFLFLFFTVSSLTRTNHARSGRCLAGMHKLHANSHTGLSVVASWHFALLSRRILPCAKDRSFGRAPAVRAKQSKSK